MKFIKKIILFLPLLTFGQLDTVNYDNDLLPASFHASRRESFREAMEPNSVAFFFSNTIRNRANDVDFEFHQDPNFYYLTGYTEPDALLILFSKKTIIDSIETKEIIYVQSRNSEDEVWTGKRLGKLGTQKFLKIETVFNNYDFQDLKLDLSQFAKIYYSYSYNDARDDSNDPADIFSMQKLFNERTEKYQDKKDYMKLSTIMGKLREIKTDEEMKLLRKAIDISVDAHLQLMKSLRPGMKEFQAQAIVEFGFKFFGAEFEGYSSILGAGENSCILHYTTNRKKLNNKDFLVCDAGAEYHGYTADITRTLPSNGKFTNEQKIIYNIVLEAQIAGIKVCKMDNAFRAAHNAAVLVIKKRLKELGIIKKEEDFMQYFFHGTSHYLGLDVHDLGSYGRLKPGQVITVEPGIYIPEGSPCDKKWWNIGVRIEDDVLITVGEPEELSKKLPKTVEEIEKLMSGPKTDLIPGNN